eukprot:1558444-Rhodomonas_salina.1
MNAQARAVKCIDGGEAARSAQQVITRLSLGDVLASACCRRARQCVLQACIQRSSRGEAHAPLCASASDSVVMIGAKVEMSLLLHARNERQFLVSSLQSSRDAGGGLVGVPCLPPLQRRLGCWIHHAR